MPHFRNRDEAGNLLSRELQADSLEQPLVLGLPRGGVPVARPIARALAAPLDVWVVRKLGVPRHEELGMGAVAEGGYVYLNERILELVGLAEHDLSQAIQRKLREVEDRVRKFRGVRPAPKIEDRTVILVDDGIATGSSICAAIRSIRDRGPRRLVLATPVASAESLDDIRPSVEDVVCLATPPTLVSIGQWYQDFDQVSDDQVVRLLEEARREREEAAYRAHAARTH